jgi:hypothetical protein
LRMYLRPPGPDLVKRSTARVEYKMKQHVNSTSRCRVAGLLA